MTFGNTIHVKTIHEEEGCICVTCTEFPEVFASAETKEEVYERIFYCVVVSLLEDIKQFKKEGVNFKILAKHLLFMEDFADNKNNINDENAFILKLKPTTKLFKLYLEYIKEFDKLIEEVFIKEVLRQSSRKTLLHKKFDNFTNSIKIFNEQ